MSKLRSLMILAAGLFLTSFAIAEEQNYEQPAPSYPDYRREQPKEMDDRSPMGDKKMGMMDHKMMKGMHQQPVMVATADGGIVVFMGGKLTKYDSMLNVIKELEIKGGPKPPMNDGAPAMDPQQPPATAHQEEAMADALPPVPQPVDAPPVYVPTPTPSTESTDAPPAQTQDPQ